MWNSSKNICLHLILVILLLPLLCKPAFALENPKPTLVISGDQDAKGLKLNSPIGIAFGRDGDMFITDSLNAIVQVFKRDGKFKFYLGEPGEQGGQFIIPWGIATDKDGRVYVADIAQHRIHIFDYNGKYLAQFGGFGSGTGKFNMPFDVFVDKWNVLNVLDSGNGLVQRIKKGFESQFGGLGKIDGAFDTPLAFMVDEMARYYIVDTGNMRVQVIGSDGAFLNKFGTPGSQDGCFVRPQGIAKDAAGNIYISDDSKDADASKEFVRISVFSPEGKFLFKWGEVGTEPGKFKDIGRIAFDRENRFYVVDTGNNRVQVFEDIEYATAPCFYCHKNVAIKMETKSTHKPFKDQKCLDCHYRHTRNGKEYYVAKGAKLCAKCHEKDYQKESFTSAHQLYPVTRSNCAECHDPHGSSNPKLIRLHSQSKKKEVLCGSCHDLVDNNVQLKAPRAKLCYICHNTNLGDAHYKVFKATQKDCLECHLQHSGPAKANLKMVADGLCTTADCHSSKKLLHQHLSNIPPQAGMSVAFSLPLDSKGKIICLTCHSGHETPNPPYLRVAKENICTLCHQKKRGSTTSSNLEVVEVIQLPAKFMEKERITEDESQVVPFKPAASEEDTSDPERGAPLNVSGEEPK